MENSGVILLEGIPPLQHKTQTDGRRERRVFTPLPALWLNGASLLEHGSPQRLPLPGLALVLPGAGARDDVGLRVLRLAVLQGVVSVHVQVDVAVRRALLDAARGEPSSCGNQNKGGC